MFGRLTVPHMWDKNTVQWIAHYYAAPAQQWCVQMERLNRPNQQIVTEKLQNCSAVVTCGLHHVHLCINAFMLSPQFSNCKMQVKCFVEWCNKKGRSSGTKEKASGRFSKLDCKIIYYQYSRIHCLILYKSTCEIFICLISFQNVNQLNARNFLILFGPQPDILGLWVYFTP